MRPTASSPRAAEMTSHAAVVARGMGKPCVSGLGALRIDARAQTMTVGGVTLKRGDVLTIDGANGQVLLGAAPMTSSPNFRVNLRR